MGIVVLTFPIENRLVVTCVNNNALVFFEASGAVAADRGGSVGEAGLRGSELINELTARHTG